MKNFIALICLVFSLQVFAQRSQKPWTNNPNYKQDFQKINQDQANLKYLKKDFQKTNQNFKKALKDKKNQSRSAGGISFVNGINLAWIEFGRDIGVDPFFSSNQYHPDLNKFEEVMDFVKNKGGNVVRWWYHTNGSTNPIFDNNQKVKRNPSFFHDDVKAILDLAQSKELKMQICLWSFDMLKDQWGVDTFANKKLLTQDYFRDAYIDNALLPLVNAIGNHPALFAWEIFNEPEGMTNEYASHWPGFQQRVTMQDIQRFINKTAGAIRRAQPNVKITNGALGFITNIEDDSKGFWNAYSDANLVFQGNDEQGYLDFYNIHYYNWARSKGSPFHNIYDSNKIDKAAIIGEYYPDDLFFEQQGGDNDHNLSAILATDLGTTLFNKKWAGSLVWSWTDRSSSNERNRMGAIIKNISDNAGEEIVDEVTFKNPPLIIEPQNSYKFDIEYSATTDREIVVEFWAPDRWLGENVEHVSKGEEVKSVIVTLSNQPEVGSGYFYKAYIRPVGTTWQEAIHRIEFTGVTVEKLQLITDGTYHITSTQSNQRIISRWRENYNARMYNPRTDNNQRWEFKHLGDNIYTIRDVAYSRYLEVRDARCDNRGNVMSWTSANDNHQKWKIISNHNNEYALVPMHCQQKALDRAGGGLNANVHLWDFSAANDNQKWKIIPSSRNKENTVVVNEDIEEDMIKMFPNPANDLVNLAGVEEGDEIIIHDLLGKVMQTSIAKSNHERISITSLEAGYYSVHVVGKSKKTLIKS